MNLYKAGLIAVIVIFTAAFMIMIVPPLLESGDLIGAFAAGFVNPYSSGYALDVILCWFVLALWVIKEAREDGVRHGWIALLLGVVPGVAVGFALYLLIRQPRLKPAA